QSYHIHALAVDDVPRTNYRQFIIRYSHGLMFWPLISLTLLKPNGDMGAETLKGFPEEVKQGELLWVDAESPTEQELADLKQRFALDDYAVEDVVHKNQRPKLEEYGKSVFAVIHVPVVKSRKSEIVELFMFFQK